MKATRWPTEKLLVSVAHLCHKSAALEARHEGEWPRISAGALVGVDEVDAGVSDVDGHLAVTRGAPDDLLQFQGIGSPVMLELNCFQG
jgi:hypothetical protein